MLRMFFVTAKSLFVLVLLMLFAAQTQAEEARLAYLVSDLRIPFWDIMKRGIISRSSELGYSVKVYSADNSAKTELENIFKVISEGVDGIVLSPTNSSAAVTLLKFAASADIPVVIADIGSDGGDYVSYISADNRQGAYQLGKVLVKALQQRHWQDGTVGIVAIPQKRANGKARTTGFVEALEEAGIKTADIRQQVNFSYQETYNFSRELILAHPDLRALWLQGSDRYQGALDAIKDVGKEDQIMLICFDAEPEFLELIPQGKLVGAGMQQPFLMGEEAVNSMHAHLQGLTTSHVKQIRVLAISKHNIQKNLPLIRRNVLGVIAE